jgi:antitoxin (DNA-binding transcriptional repressor) of toxin-antitoxin stability system
MVKQQIMTATEFKAKCLRVIENLGPAGIIVTKRGQAVAKVVPVQSSSNEHLIGSMRGKIGITGDLSSTGVPWDA